MNAHVGKVKKSGSVITGKAQQATGTKPTFQFADNRPETVVQKKLQKMANNSQQVTNSSQPIQRVVHQDATGWWCTTNGSKFKTKKQADAAEERERFGFIKVNTYRQSINSAGGNYNLGSATKAEANQIGADWIGKRLYADISLSEDKTKQYRKPTFKPTQGKIQANVESRVLAQGPWTSNGHIDII